MRWQTARKVKTRKVNRHKECVISLPLSFRSSGFGTHFRRVPLALSIGIYTTLNSRKGAKNLNEISLRLCDFA